MRCWICRAKGHAQEQKSHETWDEGGWERTHTLIVFCNCVKVNLNENHGNWALLESPSIVCICNFQWNISDRCFFGVFGLALFCYCWYCLCVIGGDAAGECLMRYANAEIASAKMEQKQKQNQHQQQKKLPFEIQIWMHITFCHAWKHFHGVMNMPPFPSVKVNHNGIISNDITQFVYLWTSVHLYTVVYI